MPCKTEHGDIFRCLGYASTTSSTALGREQPVFHSTTSKACNVQRAHNELEASRPRVLTERMMTLGSSSSEASSAVS